MPYSGQVKCTSRMHPGCRSFRLLKADWKRRRRFRGFQRWRFGGGEVVRNWYTRHERNAVGVINILYNFITCFLWCVFFPSVLLNFQYLQKKELLFYLLTPSTREPDRCAWCIIVLYISLNLVFSLYRIFQNEKILLLNSVSIMIKPKNWKKKF